jgi:ribosomal protein L11 methyltransferase
VLRLAVRVRRDDAEIVLAELLELAPSGVEEVELDDGSVEYAVYGAPGELPFLAAVRAVAGGAVVDVRTREVADDWDQRWREFHRPLVLEGRLTVRPPWESPDDSPLDVVIDPGQAFGTGAHSTTRLCLELLLHLAGQGRVHGPFIDLGCGSGVLAITAAKLGFSPICALDNDPAAVQAAGENAIANEVDIDVRRADLRVDRLSLGGATVAANLLGPLLKGLARRLSEGRELPSALLASGLLVGEADDVAAAFTSVGMTELDRRTRGDWSAVLLAREVS